MTLHITTPHNNARGWACLVQRRGLGSWFQYAAQCPMRSSRPATKVNAPDPARAPSLAIPARRRRTRAATPAPCAAPHPPAAPSPHWPPRPPLTTTLTPDEPPEATPTATTAPPPDDPDHPPPTTARTYLSHNPAKPHNQTNDIPLARIIHRGCGGGCARPRKSLSDLRRCVL